ncbi:futsch [Trypoxylus dichotomus]
MEAVNGVSDGGGPPPPSPLTGCYLLIVIGEPHSQEHKNIVLQRIAKGKLPRYITKRRVKIRLSFTGNSENLDLINKYRLVFRGMRSLLPRNVEHPNRGGFLRKKKDVGKYIEGSALT